MLNHGQHEVIRGLVVLHGLVPGAVDAVHHDVVGRARIKISVPVIVGARIDVAVSTDHRWFEAVLVVENPIRNLKRRMGRERMCCKGKGFQGGEWWATDFFAQLAPVSGFILVAVEHIDATRDRNDCYGRFISPVAHLQ